MHTLLLRGVTGFVPTDRTSPSVDLRLFKTICHTLSRETQGSLVHVAPCDAGRSFHYAILDLPAGRVAIATNATYPFLAFAACAKNAAAVHQPLIFLDPPYFAGAIAQPWTIPTRAQLEEQITSDLLDSSELDQAELHQIRHWNPRRVGDVLFNHWD